MLAFDAMNAFLEAEQIDLFRIVHGEQKFAYERPVQPGDVLTATLTVASLRQIAGNDIIGTTSEITDESGALVLLDVRHARPPGGRRMTLPTQTYTITRADLVAYAGASGDQNPIHQDEQVAKSVGLPGVIAHGMYTMALAARAVTDLVPGRRGGQLRLQVHQPGRRARRGRRRHRGGRRGQGQRGRPDHRGADRHLRGDEGARHAQGRPACLTCSATTPRCGSADPPDGWSPPRTEAELIEAVSAADDAGEPLLVLGGGSNLVVADDGFPGTVVRIATRGVSPDVEDGVSCGGVMVTVAAGENWDDLVARAVDSGWVGVEALSGIPGAVGATPIQNVGAYGQEVSQTIASVRVWDRKLRGRPHVRQRRLRLRLPHQPVQGRPRPARRPRRHLPVHAGLPGRAGRGTPSWPRRWASSRASGPRSPTSAPRC